MNALPGIAGAVIIALLAHEAMQVLSNAAEFLGSALPA
jgi:hypothetical protein